MLHIYMYIYIYIYIYIYMELGITISNWTIDSKAVSWTGVGYSFVISASIKQLKILDLILSVPFTFGNCCSESTSCHQRSSPCKGNRQLTVRKDLD